MHCIIATIKGEVFLEIRPLAEFFKILLINLKAMQLYSSLVPKPFSECLHFMHPINSIKNGWIHIKIPSYSVTYDEMRQQTTSNGYFLLIGKYGTFTIWKACTLHF